MGRCIFCESNVIEEGLLDQTEHFYHRANMEGAIAPGHSMIILREHLQCFGEMPSRLDGAYTYYLNNIKDRFRSKFGEPLMVEQGIHGQSVVHAHTHFFPKARF